MLTIIQQIKIVCLLSLVFGVYQVVYIQQYSAALTQETGDQMEEMRISRLKTLQENCEKLGYNMTTSENYSGENIRNIWRYLLIDTSHKVALNSVPKTGSTTWRYVMLDNSRSSNNKRFKNLEGGHKFKIIHFRGIFRGTHTVQAKAMGRTELINSLKNYFSIITVRHPFDRLESTYNDKIVLYNKASLRQKILLMRNISHKEVDKFAKDGNNVNFAEFLQYVMTADEPHWTSVFKQTLPCSVPYSYIAKSDTIDHDTRYIIRQKLLGEGDAVQLNRMRKTVDNEKGRYLPLFSKLENQSYWIKKVYEKYKEDFELFGYSYLMDGRDVYATCKQYSSRHVCI